jgi:thiol-disulfide isomerase/thioredoxin
MKNLILLVFIVFSLGCQQKRPEPNFYKNLYTGEYLNKSAFEDFQKTLERKYSNPAKKANINYVFYEIVSSSDSIIQPFKYDVRVGTEYIVNSSQAKIFRSVNKNIPCAKLATIYGDSVQIGGVQDKPTLLNVWFVNCPPCIAEMPVLNKIKEKYAEKVNFISITFEKKDEVLKFLKKHEYNFKHVAEAREYIDKLGIQSNPQNIFIDRQGILRYVEGGIPFNEDGTMGNGKEFENHIEKILKGFSE